VKPRIINKHDETEMMKIKNATEIMKRNMIQTEKQQLHENPSTKSKR
jgi:hypothetical protein